MLRSGRRQTSAGGRCSHKHCAQSLGRLSRVSKGPGATRGQRESEMHEQGWVRWPARWDDEELEIGAVIARGLSAGHVPGWVSVASSMFALWGRLWAQKSRWAATREWGQVNFNNQVHRYIEGT